MTGTNNFKAVLQDLTFAPDDEQQRVKAAFWVRQSSDPIADPDKITLAHAQQVTGDCRLARWWPLPGFPEWFCNRQTWREDLEYLLAQAVSALERILKSVDPKMSNAQVQAAKLLMEVTGRGAPSRKEVKMIDERVHKMTPQQLREFLDTGFKKLQPRTPEPDDGNTEVQ